MQAFRIAEIANDVMIVLLPLVFLFASCLDPYSPKLESRDVDLLVVNGFLDYSDSTAVVELSKTLTLGGDTARRTVQGAFVTIESDDGSSFDLAEQSSGRYTLTNIPVHRVLQYRVHIVDENNEYLSDYVPIKLTPPIDSVVWRAIDDGTRIYVNTHDESGNTHYYKWDFIETYEYDATLESVIKLVDKVPQPRHPSESIFTCWKTFESSKIYVNSTVQLQNDVVRDFPLRTIPRGSIILSKKYSIFVKQRALSESEFNFLDQLQKTTEGIGGLFDPQPSQVAGNIHNVKGGPEALGVFSVGNTTSTRIFIEYRKLPESVRVVYRNICPIDTICVYPTHDYLCLEVLDNLDGSEYLLWPRGVNGVADYYTTTTPICTDCRKQGGVLEKPSFWE